MQDYATAAATYLSAVRGFAQLVHDIPADRWDDPGLGAWDLRALVGHASRSITTILTYIDTTTERADVANTAAYYLLVKRVAAADPSGVQERGRQAGRDLGADPPAAVDALAERVVARLASSQDRLISVIGGVGMWLREYLPTRTFELAVHSLDIAAAADVSFAPPEDVLTEATVLAAQIAVAAGQGPTVLMSLTGRRALPASFSVV
ncbi:MAG: maleylpyruvate isomerase N-terminal domain-containing protein [Mycobacteriaceae bacterium]|nr:maleylpyruvate isomerase N-terminal domain-containing protein [Mycobacteriaceae bacterium]